MPAEQLPLFGAPPPPPAPAEPIPGAVPLGNRTEECGSCGVRARVYGRAWLTRDSVVDLCCACTVREIQACRAQGLDVPPGYGWVR